MHKIRLRRDFFETCNKWMKWQDIPVDIKILSPRGCLPLPRGYIHVLNHEKMYKIRLQRHFLKLATNEWSEKTFLLTSKLCPLGAVCPCPRAIYMYKIMKKKKYKIRLQRDLFLNLQQMTKVTRCSCWYKNFIHKGLSAPALGLYTCIKSWKNCIKSDFKERELVANDQSDNRFLLT